MNCEKTEMSQEEINDRLRMLNDRLPLEVREDFEYRFIGYKKCDGVSIATFGIYKK
jgi:hypothetical protein